MFHVKHPLSLRQLNYFLKLQSINLSTEQYDQFQVYQSLIKTWSSRQNLLSKNDLLHVVEHHFLTSLLFFSLVEFTKNDKIIDIGSGAGFPGIVLKIVRPNLNVTMIDASKKKYLFLQEVNESLSLKCEILHGRIENYKFKSGDKYNIAISRGVTDLYNLWIWVGKLLTRDGRLCCLKGGNINEELTPFTNESVKIQRLSPKEDWVKYSNYLKEKFIVHVENLHG